MAHGYHREIERYPYVRVQMQVKNLTDTDDLGTLLRCVDRFGSDAYLRSPSGCPRRMRTSGECEMGVYLLMILVLALHGRPDTQSTQAGQWILMVTT